MKSVVYYTFFKETKWWRVAIRLKTNKIQPFKLRKFPKFKNSIMALFDSKQSGSVWLEIVILKNGLTLGITHHSHIYPIESKPWFFIENKKITQVRAKV